MLEELLATLDEAPMPLVGPDRLTTYCTGEETIVPVVLLR